MAVPFDPVAYALKADARVPGTFYALAVDARTGRHFIGGTEGVVYDFDPAAEKPVALQRWMCHENYLSAAVVAGDRLVTTGYDKRLARTTLDTGRLERAEAAHDGWIRQVVALPGGGRVATAGDDMHVKLWDVETGVLARTFHGHAKQTPEGYATALYALAASPDGRLLASGDRAGDVIMWDVETGAVRQRWRAEALYTFDAVKRARAIGGVRALAFSPDSTRLAIGGIGPVTNVDGFVGPCRIEVWDVAAAKRIFAAEDKHQAVFNDVAFHPIEPWLLACGGGDGGGLLAFWSLEKQQLARKISVAGHLHRLRFDPASQRIVTAGFGGAQVFAPGAAG